jgi:glucuronoarabinoxylan endo-1,4-beta-xylanase
MGPRQYLTKNSPKDKLMTPATKATFVSQIPAVASKTSAGFLMVALGMAKRATVPAALLISLSGLGSAGSSTTTTSNARSQSATVNWADQHQVIDGFGASDAFSSASMSSAHQSFFFGTGAGQLGLSLLRVAVPDAASMAGSCTSVSASCAGAVVGDMKAVIANGGRVFASPWSPPAAYKTNKSITCSKNAGLSTSSYAAYATWLANFVKSLESIDNISLYALSVQNEPNVCQDYDSASWTAANLDAFVKTNLGPTFAANQLSTLIFLPESGTYSYIDLGNTCAGDSACNQYVGGIAWHDYDAVLSGTNTVTADRYPSSWPLGRKYWQTETSCGPGTGPAFCKSGFVTTMTDALDWAAVIDQRLAVDGANAWLYWWLIDTDSTDNQGLMASNGTIARRGYMLGQYSKFVRPGYYRIDATHLPEANVSISAYQNTTTNTLVIIATNYSTAAVSQEFTLTNAPTFATLTPTITSATLNLAQQASISVSSNSFTYTLPAGSVTTFVGTATP